MSKIDIDKFIVHLVKFGVLDGNAVQSALFAQGLILSNYKIQKIGENSPMQEEVEKNQDSEDERIRKELIDYINRLTVTPNNIDRYNSWIAWLEKQKAMDKDIIFRPLAGTDIIVAAKQALEKIEIGKEVVLAFNGAYIPVNGKTVAEICNEYFSWVEKQGQGTR